MQRISGHEYPVSRIFSSDFQFEIPSYQRPYAWTTEQAGELLDDLLSFMDQTGTDPGADLYFLGSIVLIKTEGAPKAEVIDGQQRLTTLTILLSTLAQRLSGEMRTALMGYVNEPGNPAEDLAPEPRLALRERDREFFREYVQTEGNLQKLLQAKETTDARKNIQENARLFVTELANLDEDTGDKLGKLIVQRCYLVAVSTPSLQSAYRIFSVMNDRGLDLLPSDILKADLVGAIDVNKRETYSDRWEDVEETLGREGLSDLLAHVRMIYRRAKQHKTLLEEIREHVLSIETEPKRFIDEVLVPYAEAYGVIRSAAYESAADAARVNRPLEWLLRIDNFDWMPPAIVYLDRHGNDEELLARFLTSLERLAASMFVRRCGINERVDRYGRLIAAITGSGDLWEEESPLMLSSPERNATLEALDGDIYRIARTRAYILLRLDSWLADAGATYDHTVITVEHVLPQTVDEESEWARIWPEDDERAAWVHRLGNLVLLSRHKNSSAQNYPFAVKKEKYFSSGTAGMSPFALTTSVLKETEWTPAVVAQRQKEYLETLRKGWRL